MNGKQGKKDFVMRHYETRVQELKDSVLTAVARLAWQGRLQSGDIMDIPEQIIPGPEAQMRCCIYKERAIVGTRVKLAMGGDRANPSVVEVLPIACDECPVTEISVGPSCRGCIAHRCMSACPKGAISIENHRSVIDHSKCILCGKCIAACPYGAIVKNMRPCEKNCPAKAISMGPDRKASIDPSKCVSCGECVVQCPFGAIMDKSFIVDVIQMLQESEKWGYRVYAALAPSFVGQFEGTIGQLVTALKLMGFYDVAEVALGADLTAASEAVEFEEKGGKMTSSCCPAFVEYVEKHMPDQAHYVSHTPSPMVMLGRHIKSKDPRAKVVFIGPCVAKKKEFQLGKTQGAIDCVITFEELYAMMTGKDIDPTKLEETVLDEASGYGRAFAAGGGVAAAVAQALKERGSQVEAKCLACAGLDECRMAILKMDKGVLPENFIEGMACGLGGCVQGPAVIFRGPKNKAELAKHIKEAGDRTIGGAIQAAEK
jgi:[FeFe] hydrogenase (group B1/B3)